MIKIYKNLLNVLEFEKMDTGNVWIPNIMGDPGSCGPWEWQTLGVAELGSGGPSEWLILVVADLGVTGRHRENRQTFSIRVQCD